MELADIGSRDAAEQLKGVWIYEIEEMESFLSAKVERVKKFVSQPFDRHVGKWRVHAEKHMRGCVFIGTSNRSDYLHDPTGARRFWPVRCLDVIDLAVLAADRDQLWAEAVVRYKAGERWHLDRAEEALAAVEQEERQVDHAWLERVRDYLDGKAWCQIHHVLDHLIGHHLDRHGDRETKAAVECLLRLGWTRQRDSVPGPDGKRAMRYRPKPGTVAAAVEVSADDDGAEGAELEERDQ
jgi:predicted P-loop ATPase